MDFWLTSALALGILSSLHCLGMCGPLMLAFLGGGFNKISIKFFSYQLGRIVMYACIGLVFGWLGQSFKLQTSQKLLSIVTGIVILLISVFPKKYNNAPWNPLYYLNRIVISGYSLLAPKKSYISFVAMGLINGLLPCGVVYLAITTALSLGNPIKSSMFMLVFGLGTVPALLGLAYLNQNIFSVKFFSAININKIMPVLSLMVAFLLIVRGLNLGIPYLSPKLDNSMSVADCSKACCYKK